MYSALKNVQVIISLLKKYNIRHLVLSPGSRNMPFVHSVEQDDFFKCYSMVDERGAGFFALGLAEKLGEPVLISCTSSTASSNYLPAMEEAFKSKIPLIALTADRNPHYREQLENQMILQPNMYRNFCKKAVDLPVVKEKEDMYFCERLVNEALLELDHHGKGPVQINFPVTTQDSIAFSTQKLPECRKIDRLCIQSDNEQWKQVYEKLKDTKKIMLLFGEDYTCKKEQEELIKKMFETFNCIISVEHMSNIKFDKAIRTYQLTEGMNTNETFDMLPDIIITFGTNFSSNIKQNIRHVCKSTNMEHWRVSEDGQVVDPFMALTKIFECKNEEFFNKVLSFKESSVKNNLAYYNYWKTKIDAIKLPPKRFSNFFAIKRFSEIIPDNSILHLSILNSIRLTNLFDLKPNVKIYANIGAYGIDGSLSTFLGNSYNKEELAFLIIGDLSFLYDLNSMLNSVISKNVRILLINNYCGGEFHHAYNSLNFGNINLHIAAGHKKTLKSLCENINIDYHCATNFEELDNEYAELIKPHDKAQILEIITNADVDTEVFREYVNLNKSTIKINKNLNRKIKGVCRKLCLKILKNLE